MSSPTKTQPDADFKNLIRERTADFTGRAWVFDEIDAWLGGSSSQSCFLLTGFPGDGKTAVAARLVQFSDGQVPQNAWPHLSTSFVAYHHFCRSQVDPTLNPLRFIEALSLQLCRRFPHYAAVLPTIGDRNITINAQTQVQKVESGGTVQGVVVENLHIGDISPRLAFDRVIRGPLEKLDQTGFAGHIVVIVDALDEALPFNPDENMATLLGEISDSQDELPAGLRFFLTSRPDRRVVGLFEEHARIKDLITDAPSKTADVYDYANSRLVSIQQEAARNALAQRIAEVSSGNFLYCYHVLQSLGGEDLSALTVDDVANIELPEGGLPGVYRQFLRRELIKNDQKWSEKYAPIFGLLTVAFDEGLTSEEIALTATRMTGEKFPASRVREVIRVAGQFIEGQLPGGPFRIYHKSFTDFLTDPKDNPDYLIDAGEHHQYIVDTYVDMKREDWPDYAWRHLFNHAYQAGRLHKKFDSLFELADSDVLEAKLHRSSSLELVSADYDLLFDACESGTDVVRMATYAQKRTDLTRYGSFLQASGAAKLMIVTAGPAQLDSVLSECLSAAPLIESRVGQASALISFLENCPGPLLSHALVRVLPDRIKDILMSSAESDGLNYAVTRFVEVMARRMPERLPWLEIDELTIDQGNLPKALATVGSGYMSISQEKDAMRCFQDAVRALPESTLADSVDLLNAFAGLKKAESFRELYGVLQQAPWPYYSGGFGLSQNARRDSLSAGLLALAGEEAAGEEKIQRLLLAFDTAQDDEWNRALMISEAASVIGRFSSPAMFDALWKGFSERLQTLHASSHERLAGTMIKALAEFRTRASISAADTVQKALDLFPAEFGSYGCSAELNSLLAQCGEIEVLVRFASLLASVSPLLDRGYFTSRVVASLNRLGQTERAELAFQETLQSMAQAGPKERPGCELALSTAALSLGSEKAAADLFDSAFAGLEKINDDFERMEALQGFLTVAELFADESWTQQLISRVVQASRHLPSKIRIVSEASRQAIDLLTPPKQMKIRDEVRAALLGSPLSAETLVASVRAVEAVARAGRTDQAAAILRRTLGDFHHFVDNRSKAQLGANFAPAFDLMQDEAAVETFLQTALTLERYWSARLFCDLGQALTDDRMFSVLEQKADAFLSKDKEPTLDQLNVLNATAAPFAGRSPTASRVQFIEKIYRLFDEIRYDQADPKLDDYGTMSESALETGGCICRVLILWRNDEGVRRLSELLDKPWLNNVAIKSNVGWAASLQSFANAIVTVDAPDIGYQVNLRVSEIFRRNPILSARWAWLLSDAVQRHTTRKRESGDSKIGLLQQATRELEAQSTDIRENDWLYARATAFSAIGAGYSACGDAAVAASMFKQSQVEADRISGSEQMKAWSYRELVERCPRESSARAEIERAAMLFVDSIGDEENRSSLADALLTTADLQTNQIRKLLRYIRSTKRWTLSDFLKTSTSLINGSASPPSMACLLLRTAASYSPAFVKYTIAETVREMIARKETPDEEMLRLLE